MTRIKTAPVFLLNLCCHHIGPHGWLTSQRLSVCWGRLWKWRGRRWASWVDCSLRSAAWGWGRQTPSGTSISSPGRFQSAVTEAVQASQGFDEGPTIASQQNSTRQELTGSSSLCVQTPLHCLCSITCLMFISTGNAMQPDAKLKADETIAKLNGGFFFIFSNVNELVVNLGWNNPFYITCKEQKSCWAPALLT